MGNVLEKLDCATKREVCMEEWRNVSSYIWDGLEEKWPNFCFDDIDGLEWIIWEEKKIEKRPSEFEKEELQKILIEFLEGHSCMSVRDLLYAGEIAEEVGKMLELGIYLNIEWNVKTNRVYIEMDLESDFFDDTLKYYNILKEKYGFEDAAIELVFSFSEELDQKQFKKVEKEVYEKLELFEEKTQSFFEKEVTKAKNILEAIINEGMFDKNGVLKQEVYAN